MIAIDTNVLVFAHRDGFQQHKNSVAWLRKLAEGSIPWGIPVFCLGEFIRVATHPRILAPPTTLDDALKAIESLLLSPTVRLLTPGARFPVLFAEALREADARGNLAFDAQIVAVCREHGATDLLTHDRDFSRFAGIRIVTSDSSPGT